MRVERKSFLCTSKIIFISYFHFPHKTYLYLVAMEECFPMCFYSFLTIYIYKSSEQALSNYPGFLLIKGLEQK